MELLEFCKGIALMPKAVGQLKDVCISEEAYQKAKEMFACDKAKFYESVLGRPGSRMTFLYLYARMGCEVYDRYQEAGIPEQIYWDTFYDLTLWCQNCFDEYGEYGINQYDWFFRHIELRLFRLGRLEFEKMASPWDLAYGNTVIKRGDPVMNIHIPQGEKLEMELCIRSFQKAFAFWGKDCPYLCYSWLLFPGLHEILHEKSNILKFQTLFDIIRVDYEEREAEWRIFTKVLDDPAKYPEKTSLQRNARKYLLSGRELGNGIGILTGKNLEPERKYTA